MLLKQLKWEKTKMIMGAIVLVCAALGAVMRPVNRRRKNVIVG